MPWKAADIPPQDGRVAVVTGATSGIGLHTARELAGAGAEVAPLRITTDDGFELQMATNHFGPFALTGRLIAALHGARV